MEEFVWLNDSFDPPFPGPGLVYDWGFLYGGWVVRDPAGRGRASAFPR